MYISRFCSGLLVQWSNSVSFIYFEDKLTHRYYTRANISRPWIHEAGAVTSTLHQKLKFVKNKKLVVVGGEGALLVSHLSSLSYIDAEVEVGTPFQALSIAEPIEKRTPSFASYKM